MSTLALMKILESSPSRYDRGINILTLGKAQGAYTRTVSHVKAGDKVLDIGCGTGILSVLAAKQGATVKAIDINSEMLSIAKKRVIENNLEQMISLEEMGVAELDKEADDTYNLIFLSMVLSELADYEQKYGFNQIERILKSSGKIIILDETVPKNWFFRCLWLCIRVPIVLITYILTQTTTHAVNDVRVILDNTNLRITQERTNRIGSFSEFVVEKGGLS